MTARGSFLPPLPGNDSPAPNRGTYAVLALGVAAFIVYGSLVPFAFRPRPAGEAVDTFTRAMTETVRIDSRSDAVANVLIAVPLGFALLGAFRVDRAGGMRDAAAGVLLLPTCVALAAAVEFGQVYLPTRTCSGSDVWCQGIGAAVGMAAWVLFGRRLTGHARVVWGRTHSGGAAGRLLLAYLVLLLFIQSLPLDLTPSPKDLYKKLRDEVVFVPCGEFRGGDGARAWERVAKLLKLAGLFLPVGLLAARLPGRFWASAANVVMAALGVACGAEAVQLVLHSRTPSATDVLAGMAGALGGWMIDRTSRLRDGKAAIGFGTAWAAALVVAYWQPFDFRGPSAAFDWLPGTAVESGNPLFALEELLTKLVLFAPFGVLVATSGLRGSSRLVVAAAIGLGVSAVVEAGQCYLPTHSPSVTDVLIGGVGAAAGAWVAGRAGAGNDTGRPDVF